MPAFYFSKENFFFVIKIFFFEIIRRLDFRDPRQFLRIGPRETKQRDSFRLGFGYFGILFCWWIEYLDGCRNLTGLDKWKFIGFFGYFNTLDFIEFQNLLFSCFFQATREIRKKFTAAHCTHQNHWIRAHSQCNWLKKKRIESQ